MDALDAIKAADRVDSDGLTVNTLCLLGFVCMDAVTEIVKSVLASRKLVNEFVIDGQIKGNISSTTTKKDVRVILPLPALLVLCEFVRCRTGA